ncbi:MAG: stage III sporulation protein AB, partial [Peptostreptococcaceae bacterium]
RSENNDTLELILEKNANDMEKETYLQDKEVDELRNLILTLGKGDICSQERMIDLTIENIKKLTTESQEDINKKGMVYKKLSTIIGLVVGIFLM